MFISLLSQAVATLLVDFGSLLVQQFSSVDFITQQQPILGSNSLEFEWLQLESWCLHNKPFLSHSWELEA